ncbi:MULTISPECIES: putative bifunctional diguanylate cyclase/phosphodiesterase [unclassified Solwaraspora]|uniref:putative bifunctional diguanylate cyclase/phosphodiesterase n=1 Tax=unclassified Solwaraspora TaxID=2627926 RepID=UPI00259B5E3F|nr:GGDEF domain-containing phosphodiesterase [Solwaraspora sp. WMMA2056]WJK38575.1 EAL domain-containing protein [Solwaraspora sp. WMMA2056]
MAPGRHRQWLTALRSWMRVGADQPLLPVVRRAFLAFLLVCLVIIVAQWAAAPVVPAGRSWPVLIAVVVLAVLAVRLYRRERPTIGHDLLAAVAVGVVIWSVGALPAGGVLFVGTALRALYGGLPGALLSVLFTLTAMTTGVLAAGGSPADVQLAQYGPGLLLSSLALRLVLMAVRRYEAGTAARFEAVVRSSRDVIVLTDRDTTVSYLSPAAADVFGLPAGLPGDRLLSWIVAPDRPAADAWLTRLLAEPGAAATLQCRVPGPGADPPTTVEISGQNLLHDPNVRGLSFAVRDVTERVLLTERLRHQAYHDPLTGLANRALLRERVTTALGAGSDVALLLLDIDSFKVVNDALGHHAGDALLVEVARLLTARLAGTDLLASLGGDEFAVLLTADRAAARDTEQIADDLLAVFDRPIQVAGELRLVSARVGIAVSVDSAADVDRLMREADIALQIAKGSARTRRVRYRSELHQHAVDRIRLQMEAQDALSRREFVLNYQPIHALADGAVRGVEALVRWRHPQRGVVRPDQFIPLVEASGLIVPLGRWILSQACVSGAGWQRLTGRALQINVNVSVRQFMLGDVVADVLAALERSGLPPTTLTLEMTESVLATEHDAIESQLSALRRLGVRIALDDFGTGFSSLGHLHRYPIDELKIDKMFVARIGAEDPTCLPVVRAIMAMSHGLRLSTVAEGIENDDQRSELTAMGCEFGQGFGLSRPVEEPALRALLQRRAVS